MSPNKTTYKAFSLFMAFMLLFSTSGFTLDLHFCMGKLKTANIFGKAKTCSEVDACVKACSKKAKTCTSKKEVGCCKAGDRFDCCENRAVDFDMDYDYTLADNPDSSTDNENLFFPLKNFEKNHVETAYSITEYLNYKPPLLHEEELYLLSQNFRL